MLPSPAGDQICSCFPVSLFVSLSPLPEAGNCHFVKHSTHRHARGFDGRVNTCFLPNSGFLWRSDRNQKLMSLRGVFQRKGFPLCGSGAHRTQGVNLRAALKAREGHCRQEQRLLKPAFPTQGIVNIGWLPLFPMAQNLVLCTHVLKVLLFHGRQNLEPRSLSFMEPEESCPAECQSAHL